MKKTSLLSSSLVLAATLCVTGFLSPAARAADAAPGTLRGTVTDASGKPVPSCTIIFFGQPEEQKQGGAKGPGSRGGAKRSVDIFKVPTLLAKGVLKGKAVSDANGVYEIKTLTAGTYQYRAGNPLTVGMAGGDANVEAGKTTTVDIKLAAPAK